MQRVAIARSLVNKPAILLADEPTGNLDETNENTVLEIFRRLHAEGHTLIVITHDIHVGEMADRLVTLEHGRVIHSKTNGVRPVLSAEDEAARIPVLQA
jgi:putative ABC transport system ATP-binding protein